MREDSISQLISSESNFGAIHQMSVADFEDVARIKIETPLDIVDARQKGRVMAQEMNCSSTQATLVATAISELARNIILYAGVGEMILRRITKDSRSGLQIIASDNGPGIPNIARAMMNGFSTSGGLGLGLSGVKHIADSFHIKSEPGHGVQIDLIIWLVRI